MKYEEALKQPQLAFANRQFAVYPIAPRKWVVQGLDEGAFPGYWRLTGSQEAAMFIVIREMEKQIAHLNDFVNLLRDRAKDAERHPNR